MELSGMHFVYSGINSRAYGLIFANVNTNRNTRLSGDMNSMTVFNHSDNRRYYIGDSYEDSALQFDAEIVTYNCKPLDRHIQRKVEKWLFHQPNYRKLYVDKFDDCYGESFDHINGVERQLYLNCRFMYPEKIETDGGVVGYKFTIECDNSMAWQDPVSFMYNISHETQNDSSVIDVVVDTDINDYVYPKVSIQVGSLGGDIVIANSSDDSARLTTFKDLTPNITLVVNGNGINYVSGENYLKFKDRNFVRLIDGVNHITVIGNIEHISMEFQNQRYV